MNLIQAYKKANAGDKLSLIMNSTISSFTKTISDLDFDAWIFACVSGDALRSDNWQIKRKPLVWEASKNISSLNFQKGASIPITIVLPNEFEGKSIKIRIEEIIE